MSRARFPILALPLLMAVVGCDQTGVLDETPIPPLDLVVEHPVYAEFGGTGDLRVAGTVGNLEALVLVEGEVVPVADDGTWEAFVPYDRAWRNIDIEASAYEEAESLRIPTFAGLDPAESWPGAVTLRLTETGFDGIGLLLGGLVDGLLTEDAIAGIIPPIQQDGFSLSITGFEADPTEVMLEPDGDELLASFTLREVVLELTITVQLGQDPLVVPATLGIERAGLTLPVGVRVRDDGTPVITPGEPAVELTVPTLSLGDADLSWISDLINGAVDLGEVLSNAVRQGLGGLGPIPLGGPIAFEQDLLGTPLSLRLDDLRTDPDGLGIKLGLGLGQPIPDDLGAIPFPSGQGDPPPDLAAGVHDGVLQSLLQSDLLDLLQQDISLPGAPGQLLGNIVTQLPGGDQAPSNNGWCLNLNPGEARLARFGRAEGQSLVNIYLPDATLRFSTIPLGGSGCETWLEANLALAVGVGLDGTELDLQIDAPEGILTYYGAPGYESPEQMERVVSQLGSRLSGLLNLLGGLGGSLLDLDSLLGDLGVDGLSIAVRDLSPALDVNGQPIEGMSEIGIGLFEAPEAE